MGKVDGVYLVISLNKVSIYEEILSFSELL